MREIVEYARIYIGVATDLDELENHLYMNGYDFGMDKNRGFLFVPVHDVCYVETILNDRDIVYGVDEY